MFDTSQDEWNECRMNPGRNPTRSEGIGDRQSGNGANGSDSIRDETYTGGLMAIGHKYKKQASARAEGSDTRVSRSP